MVRFIRGFFDGFGPGGMFVRSEWPGAPTQVFAESPGVWSRRKEIVDELLSAARDGRIVDARRESGSGQLDRVFYEVAEIHKSGSTHGA